MEFCHARNAGRDNAKAFIVVRVIVATNPAIDYNVSLSLRFQHAVSRYLNRLVAVLAMIVKFNADNVAGFHVNHVPAHIACAESISRRRARLSVHSLCPAGN